MSDSSEKNYPVSTPEVARMLGLGNDGEHAEMVHRPAPSPSGLPVKDLPVVDVKLAQEKEGHDEAGSKKGHSGGHDFSHALKLPHIQPPHEGGHEEQAQESMIVKFVKNAAPYVIVFSIGVFLYFFFFSRVDFGRLLKLPTRSVTARETALEELKKKEGLDAYYSWISGFYYDVTDGKVLDPEVDNSGNGLSNYHKYLLNLNPKSYDTLGLGMADSEALAKGISPITGSSLTDNQKEIIDRYFDMEVISNKLALSQLQKNGGQVAGVRTQENPNGYSSFDTPRQDGSSSGTNSGSGNSGDQGSFQSANPNPNESDIDTNVPGRLEIPSLKINVPVIWTKDTKNFDKDLQTGVVHYPGTALPGQIGTAYISGHSSNYVWARGSYNQVFSTLGNLADNTSFKVTVVQKNGKDAIYHYIVVGRQEYDAKDQAQFRNSAQSVVALSTCWPVGSTAKRLVVFGQLTQVEKQ